MRVFSSLFLSAIFVLGSLFADELPSAEQMQSLNPARSTRVRIYDFFARGQVSSIEETHRLYSSPEILINIQERLDRVNETGDPHAVFEPHEYEQFLKNIEELRKIELSFFENWYVKLPMGTGIQIQQFLTSQLSREPRREGRERIVNFLKERIQENELYQNWNKELPEDLFERNGPKTWGELLIRFNQDSSFRTNWIEHKSTSLDFLKKLSEIWVREDLSIRQIEIVNRGTENEYWVIERSPRENILNPFELIIEGDMDKLIEREFAHTIHFNRLSRIEGNNHVILHMEAVPKGRSMEINLIDGDTRTFTGAEAIRATKMDEFIQRDLVKEGKLNIFLGMRTIQIDQVLELMKINSALVLAVGQVGFSISGGRAQTISVRTDKPEEQLRKMTATLIDIIEFSQTTDVASWVRKQAGYLMRAVASGVGSGGSQALFNMRGASDCKSSLKVLIQ